ncbi:hypothetical protein A2960_06470 [Candidatus Gottesmanbacteria bacterium RIFCSPLOWO2_01_FULL_39_12b]|uniref:Uncharacterized protein n=1 Tax=Candidatus Gottesmanbacteria bacterium RIFCSPLOWO2_01_FULL_39_12b TaxID=1798388 RepID=A0A1F6ARV0_9BACT|nr:MAG: hypothetical protein A2960_06470 [Candidatus Gottesmanbacteria bacterium RIFCSPLOWO2_01_FULL_39_12b]
MEVSEVPMSVRIETHLKPDHVLTPTWTKFATKLEKFGFAGEDLTRFESEFAAGISAAESLNKGTEVAGFHFDKNELRYHNWNHTVNVVERTLQILPGFLENLKSRGVNISQNLGKIKGLVFSSIFHEVGYLKRVKGDEVYLTQGELFFDHVDRGMEFAPEILQKLGFDLRSEDIVFIKKMIRSTDFNKPKEKEGFVGAEREWGKVLEAADFLAAFANPDNIPKIVSDLYWENLARVVQNGKVKKWQRNGDGSLLLIAGKPQLEDVRDEKEGLDNYARIIEAKFSQVQEGDREIRPYSLFQFVASEFLSGMQEKLRPYIAYADSWWEEGEANEIGVNYRKNIERIELLQSTISAQETDALSIFEGGFSGYDLGRWVEEMKEKGWLDDQWHLKNRSWHEIDRHVLHRGANIMDRLVTRDIAEILTGVNSESRVEAIVALLERFRNKMRGENVHEIFLSLAPLAYVGKGAPFRDLDQAIDTITEAFNIIHQNKEKEEESLELRKAGNQMFDPDKERLPDLKFVWCVRRDQDFRLEREADGTEVIQGHEQIAHKINDSFSTGKIAGIAFLGSEGNFLEVYNPFFEMLDKSIPITISVGQAQPVATPLTTLERVKQHLRLLFQNNMRSIFSLYDKFGGKVAVWGMQSIVLLNDREKEQLFQEMPFSFPIVITPTFDRAVGLTTDHVSIIKQGKEKVSVSFGTGNGALAHSASSITCDVLETLMDNAMAPLSDIRVFLSHSGRSCIYSR